MVDSRITYDDVTESYVAYIESEEDWNPGTQTTVETSVTARPGALTFDYTKQFDVGPIELSDPDDGLLSKVWRVRREGLDFWIARENDSGGEWRDEEILFSIDDEGTLPGEEPSQFGFSFDQNGRPVLSFALSGTCYLWWYDPQVNDQVIRELGTGRTPVVLLDDKRNFNIPNSDILVFFINGSNETVYLRQRDRYNTEFSTPLESNTEVDKSNLNLELLYKSLDNRLVCVYTERFPDTDFYEIGFLTSVPYSWFDTENSSIVESDLQSIQLVVTKYFENTEIVESDLEDISVREIVILTSQNSSGEIVESDLESISVDEVLIRTNQDSPGEIVESDLNSITVEEVLIRTTQGPSNGEIAESDLESISVESI